jgi:hypothetical protein
VAALLIAGLLDFQLSRQLCHTLSGSGSFMKEEWLP